MDRKYAWPLLVLAGACALLALQLIELRSTNSAARPAVLEPAQAPLMESSDDPAVAGKIIPPDSPLSTAVSTLRPERRAPRVILEGGQPAVGATLTWTPVALVLLSSVWAWDEIDMDWWRRETCFGATGQDGAVELDMSLNGREHGSVAWVSLPGYSPQYAVVPPHGGLDGRIFVLAASDVLGASVVDAAGVPVESAILLQHGVDLDESAPQDTPYYAARFFHRTTLANTTGCAFITRFPGVQALSAQKGELVSRPVLVDSDTDQVSLTLYDGFTIEGTVTRPVSEDLEGEIIPRIAIYGLVGRQWLELGTAVARESESWGPLRLPCVDAISYKARVHGLGLVPKETRFAPPVPGQRVVLHLDAEAGLAQWFRVLNADGEPLPRARVDLGWTVAGRKAGVTGFGREDGHVAVMGVRPGLVTGTASCPGYATAVLRPEVYPLPLPVTIVARLARGATITGRVTQNGLPVPEFDITYWPGDDLDLKQISSFRGRSTGEFEVLAVECDSLGIIATGLDSPGSQVLQVEVTADGVHDLELKLVRPLRGVGRVVNRDGESIPEAHIQPYVTAGGGSLTPWGEQVPVSPDGSFEVAAFREGENHISVHAPGLGARNVFAESDQEPVDFGVITLAPAVDVRVEISRPADQGTGFRLFAKGPESDGVSLFEEDEDGNLVGWLRGLAEGRYAFTLLRPDGSEEEQWANIGSGTEVVRFLGGGGGSINARMSGVKDPSSLVLLLEHTDAQRGIMRRYVRTRSMNDVLIRAVPEGRVHLYLRRGDVEIATTSVMVAEGETSEAVLAADGAELHLVVIDGDGEPVSGATVRIWSLSEGLEDYRGGLTKSEGGEISFLSLDAGAYLVHVNHTTLGLLSDIEVVLGEDERLERVLRLEASAALELMCLDSDLPLPGVACELLDRANRTLTDPVRTNDEGRVQITPLTPGTYRLRLSGNGIWPLRTSLTASAGGGLQVLQIYRLGALTLRVLNADGVPVAGRAVELLFEPTGESVADWIAAGRVAGEPALETDKHGEVQLSGIPHGAYAWRSGELTGTLAVEVGGTSLRLISVP